MVRFECMSTGCLVLVPSPNLITHSGNCTTSFKAELLCLLLNYDADRWFENGVRPCMLVKYILWYVRIC